MIRYLLLLALLPFCHSQASVCGRACTSDVQCPDMKGNCTYCRKRICSPPRAHCGAPTPAKDPSKKQYLMIGDSISIGIQTGGNLFAHLPDYESQHVPVNAGPASKGFECIHQWLGSKANRSWDLITFNFGLHSLDCCPTTSESETVANYTAELKYMGLALQAASARVIWVDTTPVPLSVTSGPPRHNAAVLKYNKAAAGVMHALNISTCDVYSTIMAACPPTSGPPDDTYVHCPLQSPGGVHFPGHYAPLVNTMVECITGETVPPTPAPAPPIEACKAAEIAACENATAPFCKGGGTTCSRAYSPHRPELATCVMPYSVHVPKLAHPQEAYVQCWCFNKTENCTY